MSIHHPTVSIIISASQKSKYLSETVENVRQQSFRDFEVLICYDGISSHLIQWYERLQDPRLKLFLEDNCDSTRMLNLRITETQGRYIALLKAGDLWHPNKLQKQLDYLDSNPSLGLIHSWLTLINEQSKSVGKIVKHQLSGWVESELLQRNQIGFSSVIIRRDCFKQVGLFDTGLQTSFDWDMWIRLSRCYEFRAIAEPLVYYRQNRDRVWESWLHKETDLQTTIEKAYQDTSDELRELKDRSYAYASLNLVWDVLNNQNPDPTIADHYCRQALEHSPQISLAPEFIGASVAILTLRCLKSDRYVCFVALIQKFRSQLQVWENGFKKLSYLLLH